MLKRIRIELARTPDRPEGDAACGYEFVAPLDRTGHLDHEAWPEAREDCTVRRFWAGAAEERGMLIRTRGGQWAFSYAPGDEDDERIFKLDRHRMRVGEYVTVTEHDGIARPFRVVAVTALAASR